MPDPLLCTASVVLCDWRGRVVWLSSESLLTKPGDFLWDQLAEQLSRLPVAPQCCRCTPGVLSSFFGHDVSSIRPIECSLVRSDR